MCILCRLLTEMLDCRTSPIRARIPLAWMCTAVLLKAHRAAVTDTRSQSRSRSGVASRMWGIEGILRFSLFAESVLRAGRIEKSSAMDKLRCSDVDVDLCAVLELPPCNGSSELESRSCSRDACKDCSHLLLIKTISRRSSS